jgi:hypothetical protein
MNQSRKAVRLKLARFTARTNTHLDDVNATNDLGRHLALTQLSHHQCQRRDVLRRHTEVALRASRGYTKVQASGLYFLFQQPLSHPHIERFVWAAPQSSAFGRLESLVHVTSFCGMVGITHRCHQARPVDKACAIRWAIFRFLETFVPI